MGQPVVHAQDHFHLVRESRGHLRQRRFQGWLPEAEHHEPHIVRFEHVRHHPEKEVDALLAGEPRNRPKQRPRRVDAELELGKQGLFACQFALRHGLRIVGFGNQHVFRRIPFGGVNAVEDADKPVRLRFANVFQAATVLDGLDLSSVLLAHGCHQVAGEDAALHQVHPAVILEPLRRELVDGKIREFEFGRVVDSLEGEVVDRDHRSDFRMPFRRRADVERHQRRVPVGAMRDIDLEAEQVDRLRRRFVEKNPSFRVVGIIHAFLAIEPGAVIVFILPDEVGHHAGNLVDLPDLKGNHPVTHRKLAGLPEFQLRLKLLAHDAVERQDRRHLVTHPDQLPGQRTEDIAKPARLRKGGHLA